MTRPIRKSWPIYVGSAAVFVLSVSTAWLLPVPDLFRGLASVPGVAGLLTVVVQLWRDERAHERATELLQRQQDFALATASHMANVAYDNHVLFCEAYIKATNDGLVDLMQSGPSKETLAFAGHLMEIRTCHATWLTADIESKLIPFEAALRRMGAAERLMESLRPGERLNRLVDEVYKSFGVMVGSEKATTDDEKAIAAARIVEQLRDVLGIRELTELRLSAARLALRRAAPDGAGG